MEELGQSVELDDIDVDRADRLREAALERLLATVSRPVTCGRERGPLLLAIGDEGERRCIRCGRTPA